jgi:hypothetical protein
VLAAAQFPSFQARLISFVDAREKIGIYLHECYQGEWEQKMARPQVTEERRQAILNYQVARLERDRSGAVQYVSDQSKWMVGQLYLANGGALVALSASNQPELLASGGWFAGGLILSILCGLATWAHAQMLVRTIDTWVDSAALPEEPESNSDKITEKIMNSLFWVSLGLGVLSLVAFAVGAYDVGT